jgi:hypothetical protein
LRTEKIDSGGELFFYQEIWVKKGWRRGATGNCGMFSNLHPLKRKGNVLCADNWGNY